MQFSTTAEIANFDSTPPSYTVMVHIMHRKVVLCNGTSSREIIHDNDTYTKIGPSSLALKSNSSEQNSAYTVIMHVLYHYIYVVCVCFVHCVWSALNIHISRRTMQTYPPYIIIGSEIQYG